MKLTRIAVEASIAIALMAAPAVTFAQSTCCDPNASDWAQVTATLGLGNTHR
jgi:hypothetical protein